MPTDGASAAEALRPRSPHVLARVLSMRWRSWFPRPSGAPERLRPARGLGQWAPSQAVLARCAWGIGRKVAADPLFRVVVVGRPRQENGWPTVWPSPLHRPLCPHPVDLPGLHCRGRRVQHRRASIFDRKSWGGGGASWSPERCVERCGRATRLACVVVDSDHRLRDAHCRLVWLRAQPVTTHCLIWCVMELGTCNPQILEEGHDMTIRNCYTPLSTPTSVRIQLELRRSAREVATAHVLGSTASLLSM